MMRLVLLRCLLVLALMVGLLALLDHALPLSRAVPASGRVVTVGSSRIINHGDGGVVAAILVQEGALVTAGTPMVLLDAAEAGAAYDVAQHEHTRLTHRLHRLQAERVGTELVPGAVDAVEFSLWRARRSAWDAADRIVSAQLDALAADRTHTGARLEAAQRLAAVNATQVNRLRGLAGDGIVSHMELMQMEKEQAQIDVTIAQLAGEVTSASHAPVLVGEQQRNQVAERQRSIEQDAADTVAALDAAAGRLDAARARLERCTLRAPVTGHVLDVRLTSVGQAVPAGQTLLTLVPSDEPLVVRAQVSPDDVAGLHLGMGAEVVVGAHRRRHPDPIPGQLLSIGDDIQLDQEGRATYHVVVSLSAPATMRLKPGMTVEVLFVTGDRSLAGYLLDPIREQFRHALREE